MLTLAAPTGLPDDSPRSRAGRPNHLPEAVLGAVGVIAGLLAVVTVDLGAVGGAGLIQALGPWWYVGIASLVSAFVAALRHQRPPPLLTAGLLFAVVLLVHGIGPAVEANPRFFSAYLHSGFVETVQRTGEFFPALDARYSWPSTFALAGMISRAGGEELALWMLRWAPVLFTLSYLAPLWVLARSAGATVRARWAALGIFVAVNWYGQDYLSPQAFSLFCYLALLAVVLGPFGTEPARTTVPSLRRSTWWRAARGLWTHDHLPVVVHRVRLPRSVAAGLFVVALALIVVINLSHQLTPVLTVAALALVALTRRTRLGLLWVVAAVVFAVWFSFGASAFWQGHLDLVTGGAGDVGSNVSAGLTQRAVAVSPERQAMLLIRIGLTAATFALAGLGVVRRWRRGFVALAPALLGVMPFMLVLAQSYGGESILRAGVFATPFLAINAAFAFVPGPSRSRPARREPRNLPAIRRAVAIPVTALVGVVLCLACVTGRFGNESFEAVADDEQKAIRWVYANVPLGSDLLSVSRSLPWRYRDLERFRYSPSGDEVYGPEFAALSAVVETSKNPSQAAFVVVSPGQEAFGIALYGAPPGWLGRLRDQIDRCSAFTKVFASGGAQVYRVVAADVQRCRP